MKMLHTALRAQNTNKARLLIFNPPGASHYYQDSAYTHLRTVGEHLLDRLARVRLRTLKGRSEGTVPDKLSSDTKGTGDTEQDRVELHLLETIGGGRQMGDGILLCGLLTRSGSGEHQSGHQRWATGSWPCQPRAEYQERCCKPGQRA